MVRLKIEQMNLPEELFDVKYWNPLLIEQLPPYDQKTVTTLQKAIDLYLTTDFPIQSILMEWQQFF